MVSTNQITHFGVFFLILAIWIPNFDFMVGLVVVQFSIEFSTPNLVYQPSTRVIYKRGCLLHLVPQKVRHMKLYCPI